MLVGYLFIQDKSDVDSNIDDMEIRSQSSIWDRLEPPVKLVCPPTTESHTNSSGVFKLPDQQADQMNQQTEQTGQHTEERVEEQLMEQSSGPVSPEAGMHVYNICSELFYALLLIYIHVYSIFIIMRVFNFTLAISCMVLYCYSYCCCG